MITDRRSLQPPVAVPSRDLQYQKDVEDHRDRSFSSLMHNHPGGDPTPSVLKSRWRVWLLMRPWATGFLRRIEPAQHHIDVNARVELCASQKAALLAHAIDTIASHLKSLSRPWSLAGPCVDPFAGNL